MEALHSSETSNKPITLRDLKTLTSRSFEQLRGNPKFDIIIVMFLTRHAVGVFVNTRALSLARRINCFISVSFADHTDIVFTVSFQRLWLP
jgi:hypothetical protein